jgi:hypothetical protein
MDTSLRNRTNRVEELNKITEQTRVQVESPLNPNARYGRYAPGMIGWGVNQDYLIDRQPLAQTHFAKPMLRGIDKSVSHTFPRSPYNRAGEFDAQYNVDMELYRRMNMLSQRSTVKSMNLQK